MLAVSTSSTSARCLFQVSGKYVILRTFERHQRTADWLLLPCQEKCYSTDIWTTSHYYEYHFGIVECYVAWYRMLFYTVPFVWGSTVPVRDSAEISRENYSAALSQFYNTNISPIMSVYLSSMITVNVIVGLPYMSTLYVYSYVHSYTTPSGRCGIIIDRLSSKLVDVPMS